MTIGIPKALLYYKYHVFAQTFLNEIGAEIVVSPNTNKSILDAGVACCVDDACLPVKVFHGHVHWLKDRCDYLFVPRFVSVKKRMYICPMSCGLIEMIRASVHGLPSLMDVPIYAIDEKTLLRWAKSVAQTLACNNAVAAQALRSALKRYKKQNGGVNDIGYPYTVALIGHPYIIHDHFLSMDIVRKLGDLGLGVATEESIDNSAVAEHVGRLHKPPFWHFAARYYGAAMEFCRRKVDGIVYISAFSCGVDSVVIELIKNDVQSVPLLVLKIDEHTGEAGFDTRIEAFADMLKRRAAHDRHDTAFRKHTPCCQGSV